MPREGAYGLIEAYGLIKAYTVMGLSVDGLMGLFVDGFIGMFRPLPWCPHQQ